MEILGATLAIILAVLSTSVFITGKINKTVRQETKLQDIRIESRFRKVDARFDGLDQDVRRIETDNLRDAIVGFCNKLRGPDKVPEIGDFTAMYTKVARFEQLGGNCHIDVEKRLIDRVYLDVYGGKER